MVAVLVTRFCQVLSLPPTDFVLHAIFHDAEEAWIGDIATPAKRLMDKALLPTTEMLGVFAEFYHPKSDLVRNVVKLADDVEALRYLKRYADHKHGNQVYSKIEARMHETIDHLFWTSADPLNNRALMMGLVNSYIRGDDETFADDFI
jgi:5'-deoxynucleotidase YfbR-like HD superfamily hydrolase